VVEWQKFEFLFVAYSGRSVEL